MIDQQNNAAAIIAAARELGETKSARPEQKTIGNLDVLVTRDGQITSLEKFADAPRRKRASVKIYEARSFIDYINRHKLAGRTHIFGTATELGGSFEAILDFHGAEPSPAAASAATVSASTTGSGDSPAQLAVALAPAPLAGWGEHVAELNLRTTPEWERWVSLSGKLMPQEAFAEFIQDNLTDIVRPDAATILEVAQGLQGKKNVTFKSGRNLKDGAIKFEFVEAIEVNGTTNRRDDTFQVPDSFVLGIVPFVGANGVEIEARLRFRIGNDGKLSFAFILNRPYKVIEQAFQATRDDIENGTAIKVLLGDGEVTNRLG